MIYLRCGLVASLAYCSIESSVIEHWCRQIGTQRHGSLFVDVKQQQVIYLQQAGMVELADAADSKSADRKVMGVRPPLPAPRLNLFRIRVLQNRQIVCAKFVPGMCQGFHLPASQKRKHSAANSAEQ